MKRLAAIPALALACSAWGQDWPARPIRLLVGFGAGGGTDIVARIVAAPLGHVIGGTVIVENKPGAGGTIAAHQAARSAPDGYTMFLLNSGHTSSAALYRQLPFDAAADFRGTSLIATMPLVIVRSPKFAAKDLAGLIEIAKRQPGRVNLGTVSIGSMQHFAAELFAQQAGIELFHVPYKTTPDLLAAVRTGDVQVAVEVMSTVLGDIKSGQIAALAVTTAERFSGLPDVARVADAGISGYDVVAWYGIAFPARTPEVIVSRTAEALAQVLRNPAVRTQFANVGLTPVTTTPDETDRHVAAEIGRWKSVRATANIPQQ